MLRPERLAVSRNLEFSHLVRGVGFNPAGTVNMDTARRLGWDRIWGSRDREEPFAPQPNP